jgi:hypothetical protein
MYFATAIVVLVLAIVNTVLFTTMFSDWFLWLWGGIYLVYLQQIIAAIVLLVFLLIFNSLVKVKYGDIIEAAVFGVLSFFMFMYPYAANIILELSILVDIFIIVTAIMAVYWIIMTYAV